MGTTRARPAFALQRAIDAMAAHAAVLGEDGSIIAVNEPWQRFARENGVRDDAAGAGVGASYLRVCEAPEARGTEGPAVAHAIRRILGGAETPYRTVYACHAPGRPAWFGLEVGSLRHRGRSSALVTHVHVDEATVRREIADAERRHIARELHDTTAQSLASALLDLEQVAQVERGRDATVDGRLAEAIGLCKRSLEDVRCLSYEIRPPGLVKGRLVRSLQRLATTFARRTGLAVMLLASPLAFDDDLSWESTEALYRMAEESLNNVRRHARAQHVSLRMHRTGDGIGLEVTDDGKGMEAGAEPGKGLSDVRERLEACGGTLEISAAPGGTVLKATVPGEGAKHAEDRHRG